MSEKIEEKLAKNLPLEAGDPGEFEFLGADPAEAAEFLIMDIQLEVLFLSVVVAEEVGLTLPAKSTFFEMALGKIVKVACAAGDHVVKISPDADLFVDLPIERADEVFAFVDATLGELPAFFVGRPLSYKDLTIGGLAQDRSYVRAINACGGRDKFSISAHR